MYLFDGIPNDPDHGELRRGMFLLAGGGLMDPNFARSVILLCEHSNDGSFGLVLNQPLLVKLSDGYSGLTDWDAPLYKGGPVQPGVLNFIHTRSQLDIGSREVIPGVYWGGDFEAVNKTMRSEELSPEEFRFFAGYSGWGEGQLQQEIARKDWYLTPASADLAFQVNAQDQWRNILRSMGNKFAVFANLPKNTQLN